MITNPRHMFVSAIATLAIATTALTPAFAGGKHKNKMANMSEQERLEHMEHKLDKRVARLTEALTLSDAQAKQVRTILSTSQTERMDIRNRHKDDREAAKPELEALRARTQDELKRVLTADQFSQFEALQADRKAKKMDRRKHKHQKRAAKHLERLDAQLDLSDAQVAQIKTLHADRKAKVQEIIARAGSREAAKPELKALRKESAQELRALLNPDQQEKFDAMKKAHRKDRSARN